MIEILLRVTMGLGTPLLYLADDDMGYLLAPSQTVRRRGNSIAINRYSMRGEDITSERSPSTLRLFLIGDSIANGGWWTPQDKTISALLQNQAQSWPIPAITTVEVLNASANSWGPRNELAYLKRFGTFEAQIIILLINTDDFFATAPTPLKVGLDPNYPNRSPRLALTELYHRYLRPPAPNPELQALENEKGDRVGFNLEAIRQIHQYVTQPNATQPKVSNSSTAQLILAHTPLKRELGTPGPRDYEQVARQRLLDLVAAENLFYIDFLPEFNALENAASLYWDHIHLNTEGNRFVMEAIAQQVMIRLDQHSITQPTE
ncbi:MAG: SGNH/GDSL hydrolase family protein [Merismopedia sp. SIO2A8]|nr:SGNH/GDSL hydrolase family protein [Symploca sp. SIO2B6]NET49786.1 SGNH/GDSL hydrolase family protein [Merismopedia sp. SIO2A8]